jgi:hypothetical protein
VKSVRVLSVHGTVKWNEPLGQFPGERAFLIGIAGYRGLYCVPNLALHNTARERAVIVTALPTNAQICNTACSA